MKQSTSPLWNSIASRENTLRNIGQWVVGRGDISFLRDNWLGHLGVPLEGPLLCDKMLKVRDAHPILHHFSHYILPLLEDKARATFISTQHDDQLRFTLSEDGCFSAKLYMDHI